MSERKPRGSESPEKRIYYQDSYCRSFTAQVEEVRQLPKGTAVALDRTCFYPASGGQPCDRGHLDGAPVIDVQDQEHRVWHVLEREPPSPGNSVEASIDWERRFDHMQQHTGQHILSRAFEKVLDARTLSFHLGSQSSTIDLSLESLTPEEIYRVEDVANQVIFENRSLQIHWIESSQQVDFSLRKQLDRPGKIRVIEIQDFDRCPCGGTHCGSTGEVGSIKVRRWERVRQKARVEFYCGWRALRDYRRKNRVLYQLTRLFSTSDQELTAQVERQREQLKDLQKDHSRLQQALDQVEARELIRDAERVGVVEVIRKIWAHREANSLKRVAEAALKSTRNEWYSWLPETLVPACFSGAPLT